MKKSYKKPELVIKQYQFINHVMEETSMAVYDAGSAQIQYTLGSINDLDLNQ